MPCSHKFLNLPPLFNHLPGINSLLPAWPVKTLIIGTFNPEALWVPGNNANYFYGRSRYFWCVLPRFALNPPVPDPPFEIPQGVNAVVPALNFLQGHEIGLTDLLISINDAVLGNPIHMSRIQSYRDNAIEEFADFTWNTANILGFIQAKGVRAVFFTKIGYPQIVAPAPNTFEFQMRCIQEFCNDNNIVNHRLHSPTGQGIGPGIPRVNKLTEVWCHDSDYSFPFLNPHFNLGDYLWNL